ncbi:hypothetical protein A8144_12630 [Mycobacterium leprae 3125609]|nr:hypothetical protein A8144_12630 [Mycobacterium leprae 3125609]
MLACYPARRAALCTRSLVEIAIADGRRMQRCLRSALRLEALGITQLSSRSHSSGSLNSRIELVGCAEVAINATMPVGHRSAQVGEDAGSD